MRWTSAAIVQDSGHPRTPSAQANSYGGPPQKNKINIQWGTMYPISDIKLIRTDTRDFLQVANFISRSCFELYCSNFGQNLADFQRSSSILLENHEGRQADIIASTIFKMSSQGGRRGSPSQVENSQPWRMQTPSPQTPREPEVVVLSGGSSPWVLSPGRSFEVPSRVRHHVPSPVWGGAKASLL